MKKKKFYNLRPDDVERCAGPYLPRPAGRHFSRHERRNSPHYDVARSVGVVVVGVVVQVPMLRTTISLSRPL
jgi:hypothetical protein